MKEMDWWPCIYTYLRILKTLRRCENYEYSLSIPALRGVRQIVDTESATVLSLAVDWLLGILFWTEALPGKLRTSSLSGRKVTTILDEDMKTPVSLTLDPTEG